MELFIGVVESRLDPLLLGRCKVRIIGLHTHDKVKLPTEKLPWAVPMQPVTSAAISGIGSTPVGLVEGSNVIVTFMDEDQQYPIIMGSIGGIPQSQAAERISEGSGAVATNSGYLVDSSGTPVTTTDGTPVTVGSDAPTTQSTTEQKPITDQPTPGAADSTALKNDIPVAIPPSAKPADPSKAKACIQAMIAACDKIGLTSKYAKCSLLGIAGGESTWLPLEEGYSYSADSLLKVFPSVFKGDKALAEQYARWKGSRKDFFNFIYSPQFATGRGLGNKNPNDGGDFYGRGFIQLTGRSNFERYEKELAKIGISAPISTQPDLLVTDINIGALVAAMYMKTRVKVDQNDPGFFVAARAATGHDAGNGYAKKQEYYQFFLGQDVIPDSTNKPTADEQKTYTPDQVKNMPPQKKAAFLEDRSGNKVVGFKDPKGKYPLRNLLDEPDTNRLARGVIQETAVAYKDIARSRNIPLPNGLGSWEQALAPFGGQYPYSKVFESEAGHLLVFDDSPKNENISLYHKAGTFIDVDANGTQVNKIVGDGYTIIDRNGSIYIAGACNVTVGNSCNVLVQGDAEVEIVGDANVNVDSTLNIGVASDFNLAVGGNFNISVDGSITAEAGVDFSVKAAADVMTTAGGEQHILATGNVNVDGAEFHGQEGSAAEAPVPSLPISPPDRGSSTPDAFPILTTPVRPSPPVSVKMKINEENVALTTDYLANPDKYNNPAAGENGVKQNYAGTPQDDGQGSSLKSGADASDIPNFLKKQLDLTASNGYWRETGQSGAASNVNILRIWTDLGYNGSAPWNTDQTAWCMGFVNWTLKQCGYRYVQTASAKEINAKPDRWKATKVNAADAQPGDIVLWNFSHVNFVYTADKGKLTFCGGNQSPKNKGNNPNDGDVTISWPGGWTEAKGGIVGIFRPSKE